jgi:hypothetical protein
MGKPSIMERNISCQNEAYRERASSTQGIEYLCRHDRLPDGWGCDCLLVGYTVVFIGISLLIEGWREFYLATQDGRLATDGLYAVVRYPQYTGIFVAVIGQLIHWPTIPTLVLFPVIVWAYYRLAKREEQQMLDKYGQQYAIYQQQVPMFVPKREDWKRFISPGEFRQDER